MLKIKDNVDLKELEKFGFRKFDNEYSTDYTIGKYVAGWFKVNCFDRILEMKVCNDAVEYGTILLFALIREGLVEKAEVAQYSEQKSEENAHLEG